jgi:hypothetical protein
VLIVDILFRRNYDGILMIYVDEKKSQELMREFHEGICSGYFAPTGTVLGMCYILCQARKGVRGGGARPPLGGCKGVNPLTWGLGGSTPEKKNLPWEMCHIF